MNPVVSIVICFRDWGLERLRVAVCSHFENARVCGIPVEVLVSDYGSKDPHSVTAALAGTGARVVRTDTTGPWNRSAALNAGVQQAIGKWIVTTDADIIYTPQTLPALLAHGNEHENALYLIQCRDLPEAFGADRIEELLSGDWEAGITDALLHATIRPRWGMGGFAAFRPHLFNAMNGYEARMQIWGGEDNDFALRARRAGYPVRWLSQAGVAILHVWHEPSKKAANESEEGRKSVENNRRILREDASLTRNLPSSVRVRGGSPLVTVIIPTYRRAEMLRQAIESCCQQTFPDWELLVVENGSSNEAAAVVASFDDPRIQYHKTEKAGAAAARNVGIELSRGRYVVIHDDDDVMVKSRIQDHLAALRPGDHGSYGGWLDFDDADYRISAAHPGKEFSFSALLCNGKVLTHGGLMLNRMIYNRFRYSEALSAGIDYGFLLQLARNGLKLGHTGRYAILRRFHRSNMTNLDSAVQKAAAIRMAELVRSEIDDSNYAEIRQRGRSAALLPCDNEGAARQQLAVLAESSRQELHRKLAAILDGTELRDLVSIRSHLDDTLAALIRRSLVPDLQEAAGSSSARAYANLRYQAVRLQILAQD